jgi:hypothetical protein
MPNPPVLKNLLSLPTFTAPLIPTPPATIIVPVVVLVLAAFLVNVAVSFDAIVVNAPVPLVTLPTLKLFKSPVCPDAKLILPPPESITE